jgi:hypothetical protein
MPQDIVMRGSFNKRTAQGKTARRTAVGQEASNQCTDALTHSPWRVHELARRAALLAVASRRRATPPSGLLARRCEQPTREASFGSPESPEMVLLIKNPHIQISQGII